MRKYVVPIISVMMVLIVAIICVYLLQKNATYNQELADKANDLPWENSGESFLPMENAEHMNLERQLSDNTFVKVEGNMFPKTVLKALETSQKEYDQKAKEWLSGDFIDMICAVDLKLEAQGKAYQPATYGQEAKVRIKNAKIKKEANYIVLHLKEDNSYAFLTPEVYAENTLEFKTASFSAFLVIEVAGKKLSFAGEHVKVYDKNRHELTPDVVVASHSNYEFIAIAEDGYGIEPTDKKEENISCYGTATAKRFLIKSVARRYDRYNKNSARARSDRATNTDKEKISK